MGYRLINSITLKENQHSITINKDMNGNTFELDDFVIVVVGTCDAGVNQDAAIKINNQTFVNAITIPKTGTDTSNYGGICWNNGMVVSASSAFGLYGSVSDGTRHKDYVKNYLLEKVKSINTAIASASVKFEAGTTVTLYGR